jgi:uncharacterized protein (TIGR02599 family)
MMVAIAVLAILFFLAAQIITRTSSIWTYANYKMSQAREARVAFNSVISRLGAATVDSYYGYTYTAVAGSNPVTYVPSNYVRHSELRFISGPSATVIPAVTSTATDSVFFVAPLGIVSNATTYGGLPSLLNICGYYIQWSNNDMERPSILPGTGIYRFRLMEFIQPAESMSLYSQTIPISTTNPSGNSPTYAQVTTSPAWQVTAMSNSSATGLHVLANNVVALLLLPVLQPIALNTTTNPLLAPNFLYSSETAASGATPATTSVNRTPPVMRVVMYTIDEKSALKLAQTATVPNLYVDSSNNPLFTDPTKLYPDATSGDIGDLARFEGTLTANKLSYRRFDATVELPRQPWNTQN